MSSSTLIPEANMSRRTHSFLALVVVVVALTAVACAEPMAPEPASELRADQFCDRNSSGTCL
jgi:hypothetical protein